MIIYEQFAFPTKEKIFEKGINVLEKEFGLVNGWEDQNSSDDFRVLAWEDNKGIGRYRVHCYKDINFNFCENANLDVFSFSYWLNESKFNKEILMNDPMKQSLEKVKYLSNNRYDLESKERSVEEIEMVCFSSNPLKTMKEIKEMRQRRGSF